MFYTVLQRAHKGKRLQEKNRQQEIFIQIRGGEKTYAGFGGVASRPRLSSFRRRSSRRRLRFLLGLEPIIPIALQLWWLLLFDGVAGPSGVLAPNAAAQRRLGQEFAETLAERLGEDDVAEDAAGAVDVRHQHVDRRERLPKVVDSLVPRACTKRIVVR